MQSEQIGQLAAALAAAQWAMKNPGFDSTNPAFKSGFASLAAVRNAVIPVLAANGICTLQDLTTSESGVSCITVLMHKSGEFMSVGPFTVPIGKRDAWSIASAATYAKRISLQAVVVVVGDGDDDGKAVQDSHGQRSFSDRSGRPDDLQFDQEQVNDYCAHIKEKIEANDLPGAGVLWRELSRDEQIGLWGIKQPHGLNMKQKELMRTQDKKPEAT